MNSKSLLAVMIDAISAGLFVLGAALIAVAILLFTVRASVTTITFWRFFPQLCRWSQTWPPIRVHRDSVILILETQAGGRRENGEGVSHVSPFCCLLRDSWHIGICA